jgi:hypothetical protein
LAKLTVNKTPDWVHSKLSRMYEDDHTFLSFESDEHPYLVTKKGQFMGGLITIGLFVDSKETNTTNIKCHAVPNVFVLLFFGILLYSLYAQYQFDVEVEKKYPYERDFPFNWRYLLPLYLLIFVKFLIDARKELRFIVNKIEEILE